MIYKIKANAYAIYDACDWPTNLNNIIVQKILNIYYHEHKFVRCFPNFAAIKIIYIKYILKCTLHLILVLCWKSWFKTPGLLHIACKSPIMLYYQQILDSVFVNLFSFN